MSFRLHKFVLTLCVTLCMAVALWPRDQQAFLQTLESGSAAEAAETTEVLPPLVELDQARALPPALTPVGILLGDLTAESGR